MLFVMVPDQNSEQLNIVEEVLKWSYMKQQATLQDDRDSQSSSVSSLESKNIKS